MKILFIGGTGTISADISRALLASGHELYLLNRGNANASLPAGAIALRCDIHDEAAAQAVLEGHNFDLVADFIAFLPADVERGWRLFNGRTKQYIFISSASAYQKPLSSPFITESTPLANPYWQYSRDKIACEDALMRHYREDGFPITIVRPSHTYSNRGVPLGLHGDKGCWQVLQRMLDGKPVLIHGDGASLWTFTHSRDFAAGFIGLMGNPHALGEAVHITSDESLTWNQAYAIIADALGVPLKAMHVSSDFLAAAGRAHGYDFTGGLIGDKANTVIFDNSKLKRLVPGFVATTRFDQGVRETVAYLLANPQLQTPDPVFDTFCDDVAAAVGSALRQVQVK